MLHIRFTEEERAAIQIRARDAGLDVSAFLRQLLFEGRVKAHLTEEEKLLFRGLVGISNDLHQLVKQARQEGISQAALLFELYRNRIDEVLNKTSL